MIGRVAFALAALLATSAAAQDVIKPIEEIAADLAYGYCPLLLAGQFPVGDNFALTGMGFGATPLKQQHPTQGEFQSVSLKRADGHVTFGGAPGKSCQVIVTGEKRDAALARLRDNMSFMGLDFKPVPNPTAVPPGWTAETFSAPVEGQKLNVQLIQQPGPPAALVVQLFATE